MQSKDWSDGFYWYLPSGSTEDKKALAAGLLRDGWQIVYVESALIGVIGQEFYLGTEDMRGTFVGPLQSPPPKE